MDNKISVELNEDPERLLEIVKTLIEKGFTLKTNSSGFETRINGKMTIDVKENLQTLTFSPN